MLKRFAKEQRKTWFACICWMQIFVLAGIPSLLQAEDNQTPEKQAVLPSQATEIAPSQAEYRHFLDADAPMQYYIHRDRSPFIRYPTAMRTTAKKYASTFWDALKDFFLERGRFRTKPSTGQKTAEAPEKTPEEKPEEKSDEKIVEYVKRPGHLSPAASYYVNNWKDLETSIGIDSKGRNSLIITYANRKSFKAGSRVVQPSLMTPFVSFTEDEHVLFVEDSEGIVYEMNRLELQQGFGKEFIPLFFATQFQREPGVTYKLALYQGPSSLLKYQLDEKMELEKPTVGIGDLLHIAVGTNGAKDRIVGVASRAEILKRILKEQFEISSAVLNDKPEGDRVLMEISHSYDDLTEEIAALPDSKVDGLDAEEIVRDHSTQMETLGSLSSAQATKALHSAALQYRDAALVRENNQAHSIVHALALSQLRLSEESKGILSDFYSHPQLLSEDEKQVLALTAAFLELKEAAETYCKNNPLDPAKAELLSIASAIGKFGIIQTVEDFNSKAESLPSSAQPRESDTETKLNEFHISDFIFQAFVDSSEVYKGFLVGAEKSLVATRYQKVYAAVKSSSSMEKIKALGKLATDPGVVTMEYGGMALFFAWAAGHYHLLNSPIVKASRAITPEVVWLPWYVPVLLPAFLASVAFWQIVPVTFSGVLPLVKRISNAWNTRESFMRIVPMTEAERAKALADAANKSSSGALAYMNVGLHWIGPILNYPFLAKAARLFGQENSVAAFQNGIPPSLTNGSLHIPNYISPSAGERAREKLIPAMDALNYRRALARRIALIAAFAQTMSEDEKLAAEDKSLNAVREELVSLHTDAKDKLSHLTGTSDSDIAAEGLNELIQSYTKYSRTRNLAWKQELEKLILVAETTINPQEKAQMQIQIGEMTRNHTVELDDKIKKTYAIADILTRELDLELNLVPIDYSQKQIDPEHFTYFQGMAKKRAAELGEQSALKLWSSSTFAVSRNYLRYQAMGLLNFPLATYEAINLSRANEGTASINYSQRNGDLAMVVAIACFASGWPLQQIFHHSVTAIDEAASGTFLHPFTSKFTNTKLEFQGDPDQPANLLAQPAHFFNISGMGWFSLARNELEYGGMNHIESTLALGGGLPVSMLISDLTREDIPEHEIHEPFFRNLKKTFFLAGQWRRVEFRNWMRGKVLSYLVYAQAYLISTMALMHYVKHIDWKICAFMFIGQNAGATLAYRLPVWMPLTVSFKIRSKQLAEVYGVFSNLRSALEAKLKIYDLAQTEPEKQKALAEAQTLAIELNKLYFSQNIKFEPDQLLARKSAEEINREDLRAVNAFVRETPAAHSANNNKVQTLIIGTLGGILTGYLGVMFYLVLLDPHYNWFVLGPTFGVLGFGTLLLGRKGLERLDHAMKVMRLPLIGKSWDQWRSEAKANKDVKQIEKTQSEFFLRTQSSGLRLAKDAEGQKISASRWSEAEKAQALAKLESDYRENIQKLKSAVADLKDKENSKPGICGKILAGVGMGLRALGTTRQ